MPQNWSKWTKPDSLSTAIDNRKDSGNTDGKFNELLDESLKYHEENEWYILLLAILEQRYKYFNWGQRYQNIKILHFYSAIQNLRERII